MITESIDGEDRVFAALGKEAALWEVRQDRLTVYQLHFRRLPYRNFPSRDEAYVYAEEHKAELIAEADRLDKEYAEKERIHRESVLADIEAQRLRCESERLESNRAALARIESAVGHAQRIFRVHFDGNIDQHATSLLTSLILNATQGILEDTE